MNDLLGEVRPKNSLVGNNPAYEAAPGSDVEMGEVGLSAPAVCSPCLVFYPRLALKLPLEAASTVQVPCTCVALATLFEHASQRVRVHKTAPNFVNRPLKGVKLCAPSSAMWSPSRMTWQRSGPCSERCWPCMKRARPLSRAKTWSDTGRTCRWGAACTSWRGSNEIPYFFSAPNVRKPLDSKVLLADAAGREEMDGLLAPTASVHRFDGRWFPKCHPVLPDLEALST
eukprot:1153895-Pelagomonas_calceolata.AAC.9